MGLDQVKDEHQYNMYLHAFVTLVSSWFLSVELFSA